MGEHAITFDWLQEYKSLRTQGHWRLDLFKVLPRFPYVRTGSNDSIYNTRNCDELPESSQRAPISN